MLNAWRLAFAALAAAGLAAAGCGDGGSAAPASPSSPSDVRAPAGPSSPRATALPAPTRSEGSETPSPASSAPAAPEPEAPAAAPAPAPSGAFPPDAPRAPAPAIASSPIYSRTVGSATIRFWAVRSERTGRGRFEYQFAASVQNGGGSLLRGAVMVSSTTPATRVVDPCVPFGTTPPGTTRAGDAPFVVAQDRNVGFDPAALAFSITATPDLALCGDPGRVTMRRLNRAEYDNTVRDLLGTSQRPAEDFPADDFGYGFDTIGDVLAISPLLFEKAEAAAGDLVDEALRVYPAQATTTRYEAEGADGECGAVSGGNAWNLWSSCGLIQDVLLAWPGDYEIRVRAWASQAGPDPARMQLRVDGSALGGEIDVTATSSAPAIHTRTAAIAEGAHLLRVEFTNDYYQPPADRNLFVDWIEVRGPLDPPAMAPQIAALRAVCDPGVVGRAPCTREILRAFARRAWRRPPTDAEMAALGALADQAAADGEDFDGALGVAMRAVLTSPHFLFRVERDPHPRSAEVHALSDHELAARLSYFLWSSLPDATLDALADAGTLHDPATLAAQVHRMILDPKAAGFVENFAGQWLGTRALDDVNPDSVYFPAWDDELKEAMRQETHRFFQELVQTPVDFMSLFDANFTYLNDRLAAHYGLPAPGSSQVVRVALSPTATRGGIFTHGSVLTAYSQPRRTSPVKRGKWALDQLLCIDIPPPPAGVEGMLDAGTPTGTLRERLAAHRANPACASCHDYLDPIGLGLESYDAIGAWRTQDAGQPIDASGAFPDGRSFDGAREMAALVKADPNTPRCVAERTLIYALGRGLEASDAAALDAITAAFTAGGRRFESLLVAIVQSEPFRKRRGEPGEEP